MLEPRFSSDTLAMLLNIPPQKTLLRRHLTTNFNSLVGGQAQQEKREYTEAAGCTPLSITAKVKVRQLLLSKTVVPRGSRMKGARSVNPPSLCASESNLIHDET